MNLFAAVSLMGLLAGATPQTQTPPKAPPVFKPSDNPVSDAARASLEKNSKKLIAAAEAMPAEKYSFHPTPAQMTFGKLIAHIAQTNVGICAGLGGAMPPPDLSKLAETDTKDTLVAAVKQSFDYCTAALGKLTDTQLGTEWAVGEKKNGVSRAYAVIIIAEDWADHYSTAAAYLRANDILPPTAQPKKQ